MIHELKIKPEYFAAVVSGDKTFEIRNNADRNFQVGDTLLLWEWDGGFTGQTVERAVSYITNFEQKPGYVVLGLASKREQELLDLVQRMVSYMDFAGDEPEKDSHNPLLAWMYDAITTMAGQQQKPPVAVTETIRTAPERIWLQVGDQTGDSNYPFPEFHDEVSWCADSVMACEVPYVRADLVGKLPEQANSEKRTVTISGKGLLELIDFACPDHETDVEQKETEIVLLNREVFTSTDGEKMPRGVYAYLAEYPEEGLYGPVGGTDPQGGEPCAIASPSSSQA